MDDQSVEVAFVAQAFHWFDARRALQEIHRVLTPHGGLGLIWNERDESVEWVMALGRAKQWDTRRPYEVGTDFRDLLASGPFEDVERVTFTNRQSLTREGLRERVMSTSYVSAMDAANLNLRMDDVAVVVDQIDRTDRVALRHNRIQRAGALTQT